MLRPWMQRPARTITVVVRNAQGGVILDQYTEQIALALFKIGKGANAEGA